MPLSTRTTPANGDERAQVMPLLDTLRIRTGQRGRPRKRLKVLAADKGDDAKDLRRRLRKRGIRPQIPKRVWKTRKPRGRPIKKDVPRFQAERTFAWFQRKYRRLVVRWERLAACFNAFLAIAMVHLWVHKLIVGYVHGKSIEIIKAGVPAYNQFLEYYLMVDVIGLYKPDYVFIGFLPNDLFDNKPLDEVSAPINLIPAAETDGNRKIRSAARA
jgi:hypothetical protein